MTQSSIGSIERITNQSLSVSKSENTSLASYHCGAQFSDQEFRHVKNDPVSTQLVGISRYRNIDHYATNYSRYSFYVTSILHWLSQVYSLLLFYLINDVQINRKVGTHFRLV
jgi:hypothetical protein